MTPDICDDSNRLANEVNHLQRQRDELLDALKQLHRYHYTADCQDKPLNDRIKQLDRMARNAIAAAEGKERPFP